jgi:hypothetical protein
MTTLSATNFKLIGDHVHNGLGVSERGWGFNTYETAVIQVRFLGIGRRIRAEMTTLGNMGELMKP